MNLSNMSVNEAVELLLVRFDEDASAALTFWNAKVMDSRHNTLPLDFVCAVANDLKRYANSQEAL